MVHYTIQNIFAIAQDTVADFIIITGSDVTDDNDNAWHREVCVPNGFTAPTFTVPSSLSGVTLATTSPVALNAVYAIRPRQKTHDWLIGPPFNQGGVGDKQGAETNTMGWIE
jgi:hypothetical protein